MEWRLERDTSLPCGQGTPNVIDKTFASLLPKNAVVNVGVGRSKTSNVCLVGLNEGVVRAISREHAVLSFRDDGLYVEDCKSTNGTFVNWFRLNAHQPHRLHAGDMVVFGGGGTVPPGVFSEPFATEFTYVVVAAQEKSLVLPSLSLPSRTPSIGLPPLDAGSESAESPKDESESPTIQLAREEALHEEFELREASPEPELEPVTDSVPSRKRPLPSVSATISAVEDSSRERAFSCGSRFAGALGDEDDENEELRGNRDESLEREQTPSEESPQDAVPKKKRRYGVREGLQFTDILESRRRTPQADRPKLPRETVIRKRKSPAKPKSAAATTLVSTPAAAGKASDRADGDLLRTPTAQKKLRSVASSSTGKPTIKVKRIGGVSSEPPRLKSRRAPVVVFASSQPSSPRAILSRPPSSTRRDSLISRGNILPNSTPARGKRMTSEAFETWLQKTVDSIVGAAKGEGFYVLEASQSVREGNVNLDAHHVHLPGATLRQTSAQYGRSLPPLINQIIKECGITSNYRVMDIGSGIGTVVMSIAATTGARTRGVEIVHSRHRIALELESRFEKYLDEERKQGRRVGSGTCTLLHDDFTASVEVQRLAQETDVMFVNNAQDIFGIRSCKNGQRTLNAHVARLFCSTPITSYLVSLDICPDLDAPPLNAVFTREEFRSDPGPTSWLSATARMTWYRYTKVAHKWYCLVCGHPNDLLSMSEHESLPKMLNDECGACNSKIHSLRVARPAAEPASTPASGSA